jgi:hypothetical protein
MPSRRIALAPSAAASSINSVRAYPFGASRTRLRLAVLAAVVVALCVGPRLAHAHRPVSATSLPSAPSQRAEALTRALESASTQLATVTAAERGRFEQTMLATAVARRQLLLALIESDPAVALRLVLPGSIRSSLPSLVSAQLEEEVRLEGTLEIFHEDRPTGARYLYGLQTPGRQYSLYFAGDAPTNLPTGSRVQVHGIKLDSMLALAGGGNDVQTVSTAPALSPLGEQRTLVMLVNFSDNTTQPWTRDQVNQAIIGTMGAFINENSFGATWVTGDVTDWMTIALSSTVCDTTTLASQARQAATAAGWVPGNYSRWIYAFPRNMCNFGGGSFIGGSPSQAWLNGTTSLLIAAHEFGHGLGLWHSHALDCGDVPLAATCTTSEYGDTLDVMGTAESAHYNAFQKERLGWLTPLVVTESGRYTLGAYETPGTPLALKIFKSVDSAGARTWFYVEVRKRLGFDYTLAFTGMTNGVAIRLGSESSGNTSYLLDMTPNSDLNDWLDPTLATGQSFSDASAGVTITTEAITTTGATVTVSLVSGGAPAAAPTTSLTEVVTTDQPSYSRNQTVSITSTVTSGGSPVAGASVTFTVTKASGAVVVANTTTGSNGTAVYKLRLKRQDPVGTYHAGAVAKKDATSATAATQFAVQ